MDCPICGNRHPIEKRIRETQILVKDEPVTYNQVYFVCSKYKDSEYSEFVPADIFDANLLAARNEYRKIHGLLTSDEIKEIRLMYGLTQSEFSRILGVGEVTISRFETKAIQTKVLDIAIREVRDHKDRLLEKLTSRKNEFDNKRYDELVASITCLINEDVLVINKQSIILAEQKEDILSKYRTFSCQENAATFFTVYDLLPSLSNISIEHRKIYTQAHCEDNTSLFVAA